MKTINSARIVGMAVFVTLLCLGIIIYKSFSPNASLAPLSPLNVPQPASPLTQADVALESLPTAIPSLW